MTPQPIRIAITGGGLAGASLIFGLLKHPHLDVHIFESAPAFRETGASVGIGRNALSALDLLGASACMQRAGALPQQGSRFLLAQGPDAGDSGVMIGEIKATDDKRLMSIVQRAAFLRELLADVPSERMHPSKKVARVDFAGEAQGQGPVRLHFRDGSTHECDILVGADGIHSVVRGIILEDDPSAQPRNTGWCGMAVGKPYEIARDILGKEFIDVEDFHSYSWAGEGAFLRHGISNQGGVLRVGIGATFMDEKAQGSDQWQTTVSADKIREKFQGWPARLSRVVEELFCDQPEQPARYLWEHPPAPTYVSGPLCVTGDAAHATTPWQAAGAGMAIEDSLMLSTLLGHATSVSQALLALRVYDQVRRPRTQRIVDSSYRMGRLRTGRDEEAGLDLEKNRRTLLTRWDFIIDFDNEASCKEALALMELDSLTGLAE